MISDKPAICLSCGMPGHQGCGHQRADYARAADAARRQLGFALGKAAERNSEFAQQANLPRRTEEELRALARRQVAEHRASMGRRADGTPIIAEPAQLSLDVAEEEAGQAADR